MVARPTCQCWHMATHGVSKGQPVSCPISAVSGSQPTPDHPCDTLQWYITYSFINTNITWINTKSRGKPSVLFISPLASKHNRTLLFWIPLESGTTCHLWFSLELLTLWFRITITVTISSSLKEKTMHQGSLSTSQPLHAGYIICLCTWLTICLIFSISGAAPTVLQCKLACFRCSYPDSDSVFPITDNLWL